MDYRNDLEAARLRIGTLEAKLEESTASLDARDAELAEYKAQLERLRRTSQGKAPRMPRALFAVGAAAIGLASVAGYLVGSKGAAEITLPTPQPTATVTEEGPRAEGPTNVPPAEPRATNQAISGQAEPAPAEAPPIAVTGQAKGESSIASVIEAARPKVRDCYREEAKRNDNAHGSVKVVFDIDGAGRVAAVKVVSPFASAEPWWGKNFDTCVTGVYRRLEFPASSDSRTTAEASYFLGALDLR